jgi:NADH pyrophosphatase NudC (nudix superfamily)
MPEARFCAWCGTALEPREIGGEERAACPADGCGYVFWNNPTPIVAGIVEKEGRVVLVRNRGWPEKWFGLVSGFLERGETPEQAVRREVAEETSLECAEVKLLGLYPFFERNELILAYHVTARGEVAIGDEIEDYREIPIERLKPWPFGTGPAVKDWLERRRQA